MVTLCLACKIEDAHVPCMLYNLQYALVSSALAPLFSGTRTQNEGILYGIQPRSAPHAVKRMRNENILHGTLCHTRESHSAFSHLSIRYPNWPNSNLTDYCSIVHVPFCRTVLNHTTARFFQCALSPKGPLIHCAGLTVSGEGPYS